ncbi:MAG TPA: DUF3307 domain-containing protein [Arachidicoccus sp.]
MITFVKLLLAHLLSDFVLQPSSWVREKERLKARSPKIYYHVLLHGVLSFLFVGKLNFGIWALGIMLSHLIIDLLKLYLQKEKNKRAWFWADQLLHIVVLIIVSCFWENKVMNIAALWSGKYILLYTCIVLLTVPAAVFIKTMISAWTPSYNNSIETDSLQNAGKYIGILERLFIFLFIITNHWEGVGFLLAAKSIFRFGDLKEARDRKLTEYVMIGTLLSFGAAIVTAIAFNAIIVYIDNL